MENQQYHPLPQPHELVERDKEDAMGAYLMMFAAIGAGLPLPIINLIASVIYYYINKSKSRFIRFHSLQALMAQIPTSLLNAVAMFWGIRVIFFDWEFNDIFKGYLAMLILINLIYFVFNIIAAVKARKGMMYYFLFFGKIAYHQVFKVSLYEEKQEAVNTPPKI